MSTATLPASGFELLALDPHYDGACPCATVVIDDVRLEMHCWRVCFRCEYVGVHYEGAQGRELAERVKPFLDSMDWYGEWAVTEGFRRHENTVTEEKP